MNFSASARGSRAINFFAGVAAAICTALLLASTAGATVAFDPTFGSGGTSYSAGMQIIKGASLDSDGRIVVAGAATNMPLSFSVARFTADGAPDLSFGNGGKVTDAIPGTDLAGYWQALAGDVAVQPDHKLVVAGLYQVGSIESLVAVVRLNENGTPDSDFGSDGRVFIPVEVGVRIEGVKLAPNGDIVVGGSSYSNSSPENVIAVRLDSDGDPVNSFGGDGVASTDLSTSQWVFPSDVLVDGDGVIVVAGLGNQMTLTRFKANGELDSSYGSGGIASAAFPEMSSPGRATRLSDGRIVVSGRSGANFAIARFTASGQLDASYGFGGMLTAGFSGTSSAADVVVRPNGKVIAAGVVSQSESGPSSVALLGTTPEGNSDSSFGSGGRVTSQLPLTSRSSAENAFLDGQGRLLEVGYAGYGAVGMARYLVDDTESAATSANLDADFPAAAKSKKLKDLGGDVSGAASVQVAMRLNLSSGSKAVSNSGKTRRCQWMRSTKARFTKVKKQSGCDRQVWLRATVSDGHWKLKLKKRLPKGRYTVFMRALDSAGTQAAALTKSLRVK